MSHQSGIVPSPELRHVFAACQDGRDRMLKIVIENEKLELAGRWPPRNSFSDDYQQLVPAILKENEPSYLFCRFDVVGPHGLSWLMISYCPDSAPVRLKMLYASTRATVKSEFGDHYISEEKHCSTKEEASLRNIERWQREKANDAGKETRDVVANPASQISRQTLTGPAFPVEPQVLERLAQLRDGIINYVQTSVDVQNECIRLEKFAQVSPSQLRSQFPRDSPRYHFYRFEHTHGNRVQAPILFIYSMPSQGTGIRERMLYSSCKQQFLITVEGVISFTVDKKIELDPADDFNEQTLIENVHPAEFQEQKFSKPKGPPGRGPKRLVKPVQ